MVLDKVKSVIVSGVLLFILVLCTQCQPTKKNTVTKSTITLASLVSAKLGKESAIKNNASNTYALCYELSGGDQHASKRMRFMVVKLSNLQIVVEDFFIINQVRWKNDTQIEYLPTDNSDTVSHEPIVKTISIQSSDY
jgi:hypothetical protein